MNIILPIAVVTFVAAFALGFYMDWFGLWMNKEELKEQVEAAKTRMRAMETSKE